MNKKNKKNLTIDISLIAMFTAFICIGSWSSFPFGAVSVSLQTVAVFVAANVLGSKRAVISVLTYILLGIIGLPVFSGFRGGISVLVGPTGGYLIGFVVAAWIIGLTANKTPPKNWQTPVSMSIGQIICYVFGTLWYEFVYLESAVSLKEALALCVVPFIIPDIIKFIVSVILSKSVKRVLNKQHIDTSAK